MTQVWRFDRMATVCYPSSGRITAAFAQIAKHYAVASVTCPSRRGNRKGVVDKANHAAAQRWWRTLGDDVTVAEAQARIDRLAIKMDDRRRVRDGERTTVGALAGIREQWERARKVNIAGEQLAADTGPLADAVWMKNNLARAKMALPNGYCALPLQQKCEFANACLTCPVFVTTPEFLPQHRRQLEQTQALIAQATTGCCGNATSCACSRTEDSNAC